MKYIESEGAIFRGPSRGHPREIWSCKDRTWKPYTGAVPKPIEWGYEVSEAEAQEIMDGPR
jgi:hypothetical protein